MKKRLWFGLILVPVVLGSGICWARDAAWKRTEAHFRHDVRDWINEVEVVPVHPADSKEHPHLSGVWNKPELFAAVEQMKIMPARSSRPNGAPKIPRLEILLSDGNSVGEPFGFYLALKEDRGWAVLPELTYGDWHKYEFTQETCRALKKRIFALKRNSFGELSSSK